MKDIRAEQVQTLVTAVLTCAGATDSTLRTQIKTYATQCDGTQANVVADIPQELIAYVSKVACHAYEVVDEDIEQLKRAGYTEDALFEITLSAAVGAGMAPLEQSLHILERLQ